MDCFGTYCTVHMSKICDNIRVQSATQWTASVHTLRMSKHVITFVFKMLRNGLLPAAIVCCFSPSGDTTHLKKTWLFSFIGILPCYIFIGFCNRFSRGREYVRVVTQARAINIHTYPQILAVRGSLPEENGCCFNTGFFVHLKVPQRLTLGVLFCSGLPSLMYFGHPFCRFQEVTLNIVGKFEFVAICGGSVVPAWSGLGKRKQEYWNKSNGVV